MFVYRLKCNRILIFIHKRQHFFLFIKIAFCCFLFIVWFLLYLRTKYPAASIISLFFFLCDHLNNRNKYNFCRSYLYYVLKQPPSIWTSQPLSDRFETISSNVYIKKNIIRQYRHMIMGFCILRKCMYACTVRTKHVFTNVSFLTICTTEVVQCCKCRCIDSEKNKADIYSIIIRKKSAASHILVAVCCANLDFAQLPK